MIEIAFLADHPKTIPTLAGWFRTQWPAYYAGRTPADIAQDFRSEAKRNGLPVRLVAFAKRSTQQLPHCRTAKSPQADHPPSITL